MKNVCFIVSHLGSGSDDLIKILNKNPQCSIIQSEIVYKNPLSLYKMFDIDHPCRDASAIYGDHILYNMSISSKCFYDFCKFIYVIREPRASLNYIVDNFRYSPENAKKYYCFRLRRIYEMFKKTKKSIFLNWNDLDKKTTFDLIEKHLDLNKKLESKLEHQIVEYKNFYDENLLKQSEDIYEKYYFYFKEILKKRKNEKSY